MLLVFLDYYAFLLSPHASTSMTAVPFANSTTDANSIQPESVAIVASPQMEDSQIKVIAVRMVVPPFVLTFALRNHYAQCKVHVNIFSLIIPK